MKTIECESCKEMKPKYAKNMCKRCWTKEHVKSNPEKYKLYSVKSARRQRERYWNDSAYREKTKAQHREFIKGWFKKKCERNPEWNKNRQREYRKLHPEVFNKCMAKFYLRRMPEKERVKLMKEVNAEKLVRK